MLYIKHVKLDNFRCFKSVTLEADLSGLNTDSREAKAPWTLFTGDNASGKTTLLKAIALGLCDGSSAAGLLRESDSGYIRTEQSSSTIEITLVEMEEKGETKEYTITTRLSQFSPNLKHLEFLEQTTSPTVDFPWGKIFVCGYGAGRGTSGTGDISGYSAISAVYNLFNYSEGLQNPELTIRRLQQDLSRHKDVLHAAQTILDLTTFRLAESESRDAGILVTDPRGLEIALRDLADGYKSTFLWVTDFLGWALVTDPMKPEKLEGIVIIDELEQHLHAKLQKLIIGKLREIWPRVQFIASTHSPLVTRSFSYSSESGPYRHYHLRTADDGAHVIAEVMPPMGGSRTDQILATQAFDFLLDDDPDANRLLSELSALINNEFLSDPDRNRAMELAEQVNRIQAIRMGQTPFEQSVAQWIMMTREFLVDEIEQDIAGSDDDSN